MKIIIDAMGGDNAPLEIVKGALLGMEHWGVEVLLTGDTEAILRALRDCGHDTIPGGWRSSTPRRRWRCATTPPRCSGTRRIPPWAWA